MLQCDRGHRRHGHPLPIDRVESARRIAENDEIVWPLSEGFEMAALVEGAAKTTDARKRLRVLDGLVEDVAPQAAGELHEPGPVGRRTVPTLTPPRDPP